MKKAFLLLFSSTLIWASDSAPRMVVHMLNYIAKDYSGAVGPDGKVLSEFEYQEQKEFVQRIVDSSLTVSNLKEPQIQIKLHQLQKLIDKKAPPHLVKQLSESISENIIQKTALLVAPVHQVNLTNGKTQYDRNCAQCHGVDGAGDGPASGNFNPPPTNLKGSKLSGTSPFQLFNTIKLGVPGTAMASFDYLTDAEVWDIAHYVNSLIPKNEEASTVGSVSAALRYLDGAYWSYSQSDFQSAKTQAIEAYLEGVEPLEPRLRAIDLAFTNELEQSLMLFRQAIDKRLPSPAVKERLEHCNILLNRVEKVLAKKPSSAAFTFSVAFGIFLREAFESALLLITLLGVIRSIGTSSANIFVHAGWILAVIVGIGSWFFSGWLLAISGAQRELLEGVVALLAVGMLLFFGFWMHRKTEIGRWRDFIKEMVSLAVQKKNLLGLGIVSFMGVFREVFETVIFLRALLLEAGPQHEAVLGAGVLVAFVLVIGLSWWSIRMSARLPVRQLFLISSWVMFSLSFVLLGKGIHALQEAGLLSAASTGWNFQFELLGIYPSYQTLIPQMVLCLSLLVFFWLGKQSMAINITKRADSV